MGQEFEIQVSCKRCLWRKHSLPNGQPLLPLGKREVYCELEPTEKGLVHVPTQVGGKDEHPIVCFEALEKVVDFNVRVPVVGILYLRALAEKGIGLVKEEDRVARPGLIEDPAQILFRLTDVLAHHRCQVDRKELETHL